MEKIFYELKPYLILAVAYIGFQQLPEHHTFGKLCILVLFLCSASIIWARYEHRHLRLK